MCGQLSITVSCYRIGPEAIFYGDFCIVEDDPPWSPAKILKGLYNCIEKAFTVLTPIRYDEGSLAEAESCAKQIDGHLFARQIDRSFSPVNLYGIASIKGKWDERLFGLLLEKADIGSHCRFAAGESFFINKPVIYPFSRMVLLACAVFLIFQKAACNEGFYDIC